MPWPLQVPTPPKGDNYSPLLILSFSSSHLGFIAAVYTLYMVRIMLRMLNAFWGDKSDMILSTANPERWYKTSFPLVVPKQYVIFCCDFFPGFIQRVATLNQDSQRGMLYYWLENSPS